MNRIHVVFTTANGTTISVAFGDIQAVIDSQLTHLAPGTKKSMQIMGPRSVGLRDIVFNGVSASPEILPVTFSLPYYTEDKDAIAFLENFKNMMVSEVGKLEDTLYVLKHQQMDDTNTCADLIETAAKTNSSVNVVWEEIVAFRKKHPVIHDQVTIPAAGSILTQGHKKGSRLTNFGNTVLTIFLNTMITGGIQIGPGDSHIIPDGWANFTTVNGSATAAGIYSLS